MARRRELQTAKARRALEPIVWVIDGTEIHLRDDLVVTDLLELGDVLTTAGSALPNTGDTVAPGGEPAVTPIDMLRATNDLVNGIITTMSGLIVSSDRDDWRRLGRALDPMDLVGLVYDLVEEVSGKNPTSPSTSSEASTPTGLPSTVGARPEGSTPLPSPSIES